MKYLYFAAIFIFILFSDKYSYAQGILPVDRKTGKYLSCEELECYDNGGEYEDESRICLNCFMRVADSTMKGEINRYLGTLQENDKKRTLFIKGQRKWESEVRKKAVSISNQYKGGTMEMTEFVREKLLQTKRRIVYIRSLYLR